MSSPKRSSPLAKKRNPQDSTRRKASARRDYQLRERLKALETHMKALEDRLHHLEDLFQRGWNIDKMLKAGWRPFAEQQRALGYRHSTSFPASIRVKG